MTNLAMEEALKEKNIPFLRSNVGDRYVSEMMDDNNWIYGGENSGHILLKNIHSTGDGIISALQVIKAIQERKISLQDAVNEIKLYPQILVNLPIQTDLNLDSEVIQESIKSAETLMESKGRVLLRKSGTEPLIRIMTECKDFDKAMQANQLIKNALEA
jgi:phosphoglucosamine mutase